MLSRAASSASLIVCAALLAPFAALAHEDDGPAIATGNGREQWRGIVYTAPPLALSDLFCRKSLKSSQPVFADYGHGEARLLDHVLGDLDKERPELNLEDVIQKNFREAKQELEDLRKYAEDASKLFERTQNLPWNAKPSVIKGIKKEAKRLRKRADELKIKVSREGGGENPAQLYHTSTSSEMIVRRAELSSFVSGVIWSVTEVGDVEAKPDASKRPSDLYDAKPPPWSLATVATGPIEGNGPKKTKMKFRQSWKLGVRGEWTMAVDETGKLFAIDSRRGPDAVFEPVCATGSAPVNRELTPEKIFSRIMKDRLIKLSRAECEALNAAALRSGTKGGYRNYLVAQFKKTFSEKVALEIPIPETDSSLTRGLAGYAKMDPGKVMEILGKEIEAHQAALGHLMKDPDVPPRDRESAQRDLEAAVKIRADFEQNIPAVRQMQDVIKSGFVPIGEMISFGTSGASFVTEFEMIMNPKTNTLEVFLTPGIDDHGNAIAGHLSPAAIVSIDKANLSPEILENLNTPPYRVSSSLDFFLNEALKSSCDELP